MIFSRLPYLRNSCLVLLGLAACLPTYAQAEEKGLLEMRETRYNTVFVHDRDGLISMTFGHNRRHYLESSYNPKDERELPVAYTRYMTVGLIYPRQLRSLLAIGLGGGRTSWYLHRYLPDMSVTEIELDADVIALAKKYFGIREERNYAVVENDGRSYLMRTPARYDMVFLDAYRGPFVPFHLMTTEFYKLVKSRLNEGGVIVQNVEPTTMLFDSAVATMRAVFDQVEFFAADGNVVSVAYDGPQRPPQSLLQAAQDRQKQFGFRYALPDFLKARRFLAADPNAKALTDDFAPVESLKAIERHNRKWE